MLCKKQSEPAATAQLFPSQAAQKPCKFPLLDRPSIPRVRSGNSKRYVNIVRNIGVCNRPVVLVCVIQQRIQTISELSLEMPVTEGIHESPWVSPMHPKTNSDQMDSGHISHLCPCWEESSNDLLINRKYARGEMAGRVIWGLRMSTQRTSAQNQCTRKKKENRTNWIRLRSWEQNKSLNSACFLKPSNVASCCFFTSAFVRKPCVPQSSALKHNGLWICCRKQSSYKEVAYLQPRMNLVRHTWWIYR